jgi:hypothetical protein
VKTDFRYSKNGDTYTKGGEENAGQGKYALANGVKGFKVSGVSYDKTTGGDGLDDETLISTNYYLYVGGETSVTVNAQDDSVKCNYGSITIDNSTLNLTTYDDGVSSDGITTVVNSDIPINSSYEGLEGGQVLLKGANNRIRIKASDDGINAATDYTDLYPNLLIQIDDGYTYVDAEGDGLDSNGDIKITGGTTIIEGTTSGGNNALDVGEENGGKLLVNGGTLFACGSSDMAVTPDASSTIHTVCYFGNTIASGSVMTLSGPDGTPVITYTIGKNSGEIIISSPLIEEGKTYTLYQGTTSLATFEIVFWTMVNTVGTSGGQGGGQGGPGGNQPGGSMPGGQPGTRP